MTDLKTLTSFVDTVMERLLIGGIALLLILVGLAALWWTFSIASTFFKSHPTIFWALIGSGMSYSIGHYLIGTMGDDDG